MGAGFPRRSQPGRNSGRASRESPGSHRAASPGWRDFDGERVHRGPAHSRRLPLIALPASTPRRYGDPGGGPPGRIHTARPLTAGCPARSCEAVTVRCLGPRGTEPSSLFRPGVETAYGTVLPNVPKTEPFEQCRHLARFEDRRSGHGCLLPACRLGWRHPAYRVRHLLRQGDPLLQRRSGLATGFCEFSRSSGSFSRASRRSVRG